MEGENSLVKPKFLKRRESIVAQRSLSEVRVTFDRLKTILSLAPEDRSESHVHTLMAFSKQIKFFEELRSAVGEYAHSQCCKYLNYLQYPAGKVLSTQLVYHEGESGAELYIVLAGSCAVISLRTKPNGKKKFQLLSILRPGDCFGEVALLSKKPHATSIMCRELSHFAVLDREDYVHILAHVQEKEKTEKIKLLQQHPVFGAWTEDAIKHLSTHFHLRNYQRKQVVYTAGQKVIEVYLVKEGSFQITKEVSVFTTANGQPKAVRKQAEMLIAKSGDLLGARNVLTDSPFDTTCVCTSSPGVIMCISLKNFKRMVSASESTQSILSLDHKKEEQRLTRLKLAMKNEESRISVGFPVSALTQPVLKHRPGHDRHPIEQLLKITTSQLFKSPPTKVFRTIAGLNSRTLSMPTELSVSSEAETRLKACSYTVDGGKLSKSMSQTVVAAPMGNSPTQKQREMEMRILRKIARQASVPKRLPSLSISLADN